MPGKCLVGTWSGVQESLLEEDPAWGFFVINHGCEVSTRSGREDETGVGGRSAERK